MVTGYIIMSKPSSDSEIKIETTKEAEQKIKSEPEKKQNISIKYIDKKEDRKQIESKEIKISEATNDMSNSSDSSVKEEPSEQPAIANTNKDELDLPENYKDFIPVTQSEVGDKKVVIIADREMKRNENTPPSVPFLISGKINGESFTVALPATYKDAQNAIAFKGKDGKTVVKNISSNELLQSGMINVGELEAPSNDEGNGADNEQSDSDTENENPVSQESLVPPMAPQI